eukprot:scaffold3070_cov128-Cylindrotheca_fusiformis.AAC.2
MEISEANSRSHKSWREQENKMHAENSSINVVDRARFDLEIATVFDFSIVMMLWYTTNEHR